MITQVFLNGIIEGLLLAALGLGFSIVYNSTRVFHVALGAIYTLAPYLLMFGLKINLGWPVSLIISLTICVIISLICHEFLHWPLERQKAPTEVHLIASLGMYIVLIQIIVIIWGNNSFVLRSGIDQVHSFANLQMTSAQIYAVISVLLLFLAFFVIFQTTNIGLHFKAMSDNPTLVSLLGKNVLLLRRLVFFFSAIIIAITSILSAIDIGFEPYGGLYSILLGAIVTITAGRNSYFAVLVTGIVLGLLRAFVIWFGSAEWEEALMFVLLALILFFRPNGLFAQKYRAEEVG